jgi:rod shape determining protein RodA
MRKNIALRAADLFRFFFGHFNPVILVCTFALIAAGAFSIYSATYTLAKVLFIKQMFWYAAGVIVMIIMANVNYNIWIGVANQLYGFVMFLLLLVLVMGHTSLGAQRWLNLGFFHIQPSEFMKIIISLALVRFILVNQKDAFSYKNILKILLLIGFPAVLIIIQPDLGSTILMIPLVLVILFIGDMPWKKLAGLITAGVLALPLVYILLKDYQKERLQVFINPHIDRLGAGYNVIQSMIAVGSGELAGKGWLQGTQSQLNFIPIKYTDFVFAVISEEFGFLGALVIIFIYLVLILEGLKVVKMCPQSGGKMLGAALTMMLFAQFAINIGMNIGLMPVTGITLPLLSYGGSSILVTMVAIGMLQNIHREYIKGER